MPGRVVVVGSVNVDLVVRAARLPGPGETVSGGVFEKHHGGKGGNQSVAAARLGAPVVFVGAVGDDAFGAEARAALEAEGIDTSHATTLPGEATGVAIIAVDDRAENLIAVASGANGRIDPEAVRAAFADLDVGPDDVVLSLHEIPTRTVREALTLARAAGARTVFNPAPADRLDRATFGLADILTPNRGELRQLVAAERTRTGTAAGSGDDLARAAASLLVASSEGPGVREAVVVTVGAAGALLVEPGSTVAEIPAPAVEAVDTTGGGDAFNGALAAGLATGLDLEQAVGRAVAAAALSTTRAGAREGMPTLAELQARFPGS